MKEFSSWNLAAMNEAIAAAIPDRECVRWQERSLTYSSVAERSRRFANALIARGVTGGDRQRRGEAPWQSHLPHLAICLHNGNEYLESMLGAFKARCAPVNVNYRYVGEELAYLLADAGPAAIVYDAVYRDRLTETLQKIASDPLLIEVGSAPGNQNPGALAYETLLEESSPEIPITAPFWSADDLYVLYTGGTTGMPKGVLWRQGDVFAGALDGFRRRPARSIEAVVADLHEPGRRMMPLPPFMHGSGHWTAFWALHVGDTVVIQDSVEHFDPRDALEVIEREQVTLLVIVGDAFARPLLDVLDQGGHDLSCLRLILNSAAPLSLPARARLLEHLPQVRIVDGVGSSESGGQLHQARGSDDLSVFEAGPHTRVLAPDRTTLLEPGHDGIGWLAKSGPLPLGYLDDREKTEATFVSVDGLRWVVAGDRAIHRPDGLVRLLGRDSVTINTGGEKVFVEEVEAALRHHPAVRDVVVCGRPSPRWGEEVVAVVELAGEAVADDLLADLTRVAGEHVARYKLPKDVVVVDRIQRSPSGKPDYTWARRAIGA